MRVLVTGAGGFVGRAVVPRLAAGGHAVRAAARRGGPPPETGRWCEGSVEVGDIGPGTDWARALDGVDAVVHLAARVHRVRDAATDPLAEYRRVNAAGTRRLAEAAARAGVRRLVLLSSVKAVADGPSEAPLDDATPPAPASPYGVSKLEAEEGLAEVSAATGLEAVVLRPPLVYGPGVGANFLGLLRACARGLPLPLGAVRNRRSLVFVGNLADAVALCLEHPAAAGRRFLLHDGPPVSTPDLVRAVAAALGRPARLLPVPPPLLAAGAALLGRRGAAERLAGSLFLDDRGIRETLGWRPPHAMQDGLRATADWYMTSV